MTPNLRRTPIKRRRTQPRRSSRVLDPAYLDFLRALPCWACYREVYAFFAGQNVWEFDTHRISPVYGRQKSPTEAAHIGLSTSHRGASQKHSDLESIPLCREHHTEGRESIHKLNPEAFFAHYGTDRDEVILRFQALYREHCR